MLSDKGLGFALLLVGAGYLGPARSLPRLATAVGPIGADGFPSAIAVGFMTLGLLFLVRGFRQNPAPRAKQGEEPKSGREEAGQSGGTSLRKDLAGLGLTGVFVAALAPVGLFMTTPVYLLAIICLMSNPRRWRRALLIAVTTTIALYLIFVAGLGVAVPLWPAGDSG